MMVIIIFISCENGITIMQGSAQGKKKNPKDKI